jgi:hypothetical protein
MAKVNSVELYDANKRAEQDARLEMLRNKNFFGTRLQGSYDDGLSVDEIKFLRASNKSFLDVMTTIDGFRKLTPQDQEAFFSEANEATRISLENDGYVSAEIQSLAGSPAEEQEILDSRRAAEQQKLFQQSREAEELIARKELAYPGIEKVDENLFRLTVDPGDGTAAEVFQGTTPAETFQKLIESKKHATRELRRRAKSVKVTAEMRALTPEIVNYPPLMEKVTLTPEQLYDFTAAQSDPLRSVEAIRMLRLAGMTQEEVDRHNEVIVRSRETEARSIADAWIKNHPEFYVCPENLQSLMTIFENMNWACTSHNLDLSLSCLQEQDVLIGRPAESEVEAPVVPTPTRRIITPPTAASAPVAPHTARPVAQGVRRPLNNSSVSGTSSPRFKDASSRTAVQAMSATEYASYTAADMRSKYKLDPAFQKRVDAYWAAGGR